ncbi:MAG: ABC transporter permease, partial [Clostridiales Family XIII bacterium]|nr:ABC transporter permease [Clostridiales Family XIII bacterium]
MFNKLGKKKFFVPIVPAILIFCLISLIAYPMMKMTPKDLPFAIVSLDEGQTTSQGDINLGNQIVSGVTTAVTEESPIIWDKVDSEQAVHEALDNNEYYGALVIPSDYTKQQIAAQSADADLIDGLPVI